MDPSQPRAQRPRRVVIGRAPGWPVRHPSIATPAAPTSPPQDCSPSGAGHRHPSKIPEESIPAMIAGEGYPGSCLELTHSRIEGVVVAHTYPCIGILTHDLPALRDFPMEYFPSFGRKSHRRFGAADKCPGRAGGSTQIPHFWASPFRTRVPQGGWPASMTQLPAHVGSRGRE